MMAPGMLPQRSVMPGVSEQRIAAYSFKHRR